jgi:tetratricopeptide (TPR) repeat protein
MTLGASIVLAAVLAAGGAAPARGRIHSPAAEPAPVGPEIDFERGKNAFARGEYGRALELLRPLVYPDVRLETEGEVVQAHRMLGVASLFENDPESARREFRKLLELRPDYRFDPLLDPPRVVDFFNAVVKEEEAELSAIEAKRRRREEELAARQRREAERLRAQQAVVIRYDHHSYGVNFIPFGAGQFQNGQRTKGWWFFGAEAALGGASLAAFATNFALFGIAPHRRCLSMQPTDANGLPQRCPDDQIDRSDENLSTNLTRVQVVTGGLFFAAAIWGVIDALRHYESDVIISPTPTGLAAQARF